MIETKFHIGDSSFPVLAFAIHNGYKMPVEMMDSCGLDEAGRLREEDPYTEGFAKLFANHIVVYTSRFTIDLNRNPEKAVYLKPEDAWGLPVRSSELSTDLLQKLHTAYNTWYKLAAYQIDRMLSHHKKLLILDLHSYNHRRRGALAMPDSQEQNPDIIIGRNILPSAVYPKIDRLRYLLDGQAFRGIKLDCRCDVKFPGGYFSRWVNSSYGDKVLCLAIEFKKIFMDEWTGELDISAYNQLKDVFYKAVMEFVHNTDLAY